MSFCLCAGRRVQIFLGFLEDSSQEVEFSHGTQPRATAAGRSALNLNAPDPRYIRYLSLRHRLFRPAVNNKVAILPYP